jgi:Holliday junction resolvase
MPNPQKIKGTRWERDSVKLLNKKFPDTWRRIALSGALGTMLDMPILMPDISGKYEHLDRKVVGECKVGYGGKQMKIEKEWFDGIREIAEKNYALPVVVLKFEKSRTGVKHIMCLDFEAWDSLMIEMAEMRHELLTLHEKLADHSRYSRDVADEMGIYDV